MLRLEPRLRPVVLLLVAVALRLAVPRDEPDRLVAGAVGATLRLGSDLSDTTTVMWLVRLLIR